MVGVALVVLVGGVAPLLIVRHYGALGIPRNDDWAYLTSAFDFRDHGRLDGGDWASMTLVGQLVAALPVLWAFGNRVDALQAATLALGVVGLLAVLDLGARLLPTRRAVLAALLVALSPLWASLAVSFMTDVPAFALAMVCLALGARGIGDDRVRWPFWLSLAVGCAAFTVRESTAVAPIAVTAAALWTVWRHRASRTRVLLGFGGLLAAVGVFWWWHAGLDGWNALAPEAPGGSSLRHALVEARQDATLLGLLVLPAVALAGPRRTVTTAWARAPRTTAVLGASATVWLLAGVVTHWSPADFFGHNYVEPTGSLRETMAGEHPLLVPRPVLAALAVLGVLSAVLVLCRAIAVAAGLLRARPVMGTAPRPPAAAVVALAAVGYTLLWVVPPALGIQAFDRYGLPLVPLVAIGVLRGAAPVAATRRVDVLVAGAALVVVALFGAVYAVNTASFDGTRWRVDELAAEAAGSPIRVAGGFEWSGWHGGIDATKACVVVTAATDAPADDPKVVAAGRVHVPTGDDTWIVARRVRDC